jgi:hypothetical protein
MENINKRIALENRRQFSLKAAQTPTMETFREPRTNKTNKKPKPTNQPTKTKQKYIHNGNRLWTTRCSQWNQEKGHMSDDEIFDLHGTSHHHSCFCENSVF